MGQEIAKQLIDDAVSVFQEELARLFVKVKVETPNVKYVAVKYRVKYNSQCTTLTCQIIV